jgi:hypothetical protein
MSIANIQKEKFLNVIYRNLYSSGYIPKESEILEFFSQYFSAYQLSQPLPMDPEIFRQVFSSNVDIFNQKMLYALFNVEVIYDSILENSEEIMKITTALNKRLQNLKARRIQLENKIDDLLFVNQNSDSIYASYTDTFSTADGTDLGLTTAFVDISNGRVSLPTLSSAVFDLISAKSVVPGSATYSLSFNRNLIYTNQSVSSDQSFFPSVFDGLENTEWQKAFFFDSIGLVTFTLNLPINKNVLLSNISGKLNTISPVDIFCSVTYADGAKPNSTHNKKSSKDYDRFSFNFEAGNVTSIDLILVKSEPDYIEKTKMDKYAYRFGIRDIAISGRYHDRSATYVSKPISLKTKDNKNLAIDAVSLSVNESGFENGTISYFVAEDNPTAQIISDFNWIPISTKNDNLASYPSIVSFDGTYIKSKKIVDKVQNTEFEIEKIPLAAKSDVSNINQQNPIIDLYPDQLIYRTAKINIGDDPYDSYILSGTGLVRGYYINYTNQIYNEADGLSTWNSIIAGRSSVRQLYTIPPYNVSTGSTFFVGPNVSGISILLETKILCSSQKTFRHKFIKNDSVSKDWDIAVYLNGKPTYIPAGQFSQLIEWNFKEGSNIIKIAIDVKEKAKGAITLMEEAKLADYGLIYLDYYSYVDPLEFKKNRSVYDYVFTVENFFGNKEIFSRANIGSSSRIFYLTNNPNRVESIRVRADLSRSKNPIGSPVIDSFTVKFKNNQKLEDEQLG